MEDSKCLMDMFTGSPLSVGTNPETGTRTPTTPPRYLSRQFSGTGYSDGGSPNTPGSFDQSMRWGQSGTAGWDFPADPYRSATPGTETGGLTLQQLINYYGQNPEMSQPLFHLPTDYLTWQNLQQISTLLMLSQSNINVGPFLGKQPADNVYPLDSYLATPSLYIDTDALSRAAKYHRKAATTHDANCTWSGSLPQGSSSISGYSPKVFLGGVPWDITEQMLITTFKHIGPVKVEWPGKDQHAAQPKGYVYVIFESDKQVRMLISLCNNNKSNGSKEDAIYYKISSKRMKSKEVQVIPWALDDSNVMRGMSQKLDANKTVFVGALHGMLNAAGLAKIMNDLFGGVIYAGIDTDKYKYPIGSGRVTFDNKHSYTKAVQAAFIEVKTSKFSKKIQVDPYLEDTICSMCGVQQGPYFCRELLCFRYYCRTCWHMQHPVTDAVRSQHNPLMKALRPPPSVVV